MRHTSGHGSDDDRTDTTLREGQNAASKRGGDDDSVVLGLLLMQRVLPASLTLNRGGTRVARVRDFR
jgi:hypothetical protein